MPAVTIDQTPFTIDLDVFLGVPLTIDLDRILFGSGEGSERVTIDLDDAAGNPIVGASLEITNSEDAVVGTFISNDEGKLIVYLDPGTYSLVISHPDFEFDNPSTLTVEDL